MTILYRQHALEPSPEHQAEIDRINANTAMMQPLREFQQRVRDGEIRHAEIERELEKRRAAQPKQQEIDPLRKKFLSALAADAAKRGLEFQMPAIEEPLPPASAPLPPGPPDTEFHTTIRRQYIANVVAEAMKLGVPVPDGLMND